MQHVCIATSDTPYLFAILLMRLLEITVFLFPELDPLLIWDKPLNLNLFAASRILSALFPKNKCIGFEQARLSHLCKTPGVFRYYSIMNHPTFPMGFHLTSPLNPIFSIATGF